MKALSLLFWLALALAATPGVRAEETTSLNTYCQDLAKAATALHWELDPCKDIEWKTGGTSSEGRPLIYAEFGDPTAKNTTLIFSMVHGDEITPLYLALELIQWMNAHKERYTKVHVAIAPLVNPDGFFKVPRTRMNAHGVDVNRNFPTTDWKEKALAAWKVKYHSDPRRFPGPEPRSEPETVFQDELIKKIKPQKIISIHAPLNFLDYDGPTSLSLAKFSKEYVRECLKLRASLKAISSGFFPGSLGNYSGRELGIPTLTLELPTADPKKARQYWLTFSRGIGNVIRFELPVEPLNPT